MLKILLLVKENQKIKKFLEHDYHLETHDESKPLLEKIAMNGYDCVVVEQNIRIIESIKKADPRVAIVYIGNESDEIEAIKAGAAAYFRQPIDTGGFQKFLLKTRALVAARRESAELEMKLADNYNFEGVVGKNAQMLEIFEFLNHIAPYFKIVTIMGETGTGKEVIAKALHSLSPSAPYPFISCNCGALVENLVESEFFGHQKGAFTGAVSDKIGIFEAAQEGIVFLDEIGDLPLSFQPHLLRVLQNGEFRRVGSTKTLQAKCRVIAATNRNLEEEVKKGRFRKDLFYRLTPLTINVPPLRERKDDIALLSRFILNKFQKRTGKKILGISRNAQAALFSYDWLGNVRELENVIEHAAILAKEDFIRLEIIPSYIREYYKKKPSLSGSLEEVIRKHIEEALQQSDNNHTHAAEFLGISRRALLRKIKKYSIQ